MARNGVTRLRLGNYPAAALGCMIVSSGVAACSAAPPDPVERRTGALNNPTSYVEKIVVPAYYNQGTTSRSVLASTNYSGYAIANFNDGPGSAVDSTDLAWVQSMQSAVNKAGTKVVGYVDERVGGENGPLRWVGDLVTEVHHWKDWYGVDGIFFDDAQRNAAEVSTEDIARMEGLQQLVSDYVGATATVMFNWGQTGQAQQYVYCSQNVGNHHPYPIFSIYEGIEANHHGASFPDWVKEYQPDTFSHLIYAAASDGSNLSADMQDARTSNAAQVFVTDGPIPSQGDTWGALPGYYNPPSNLWSLEVALSTAGPYSDYPANNTLTTFTCPSVALYPPWLPGVVTASLL